MDGSVFSEQYGELHKASRFVRQRFEPADQFTKIYVEELLDELGLTPQGQRDSSKLKYIRCMSDFLACIMWFYPRSEVPKVIAWMGTNSEYTGGAYSGKVAREVREVLQEHGYLDLRQESSKRDRLARLYDFDPSLLHQDLKFQHHYHALVEVRGKKKRNWGKDVRKGERLSLGRFRPEVDAVEADVLKINKMMAQQPLELWTGEEFKFCKRIFNDACLTSGGRYYGEWQQEKEDDRLCATIQGHPVCEIDLKASFLGIANFVFGDGQRLPFDAYSDIPFAGEVLEGRELAKSLVTAYVGSRGRTAQFPRGKRCKVTGERVSLKDKHNLPTKKNVHHYLDQIIAAYPFLEGIKDTPVNLMFLESEIMTTAMLELIDKGIVSYPVHDCLLVQQRHKEQAVEGLHNSMRAHLGGCIHMDVTYLDEDNDKQVEKIIAPSEPCSQKLEPTLLSKYSWNVDLDSEVIDDEDFNLLEDDDYIL